LYRTQVFADTEIFVAHCTHKIGFLSPKQKSVLVNNQSVFVLDSCNKCSVYTCLFASFV